MIFNVGAGGASNAESIKYDNSLSGLEATNVQGALDEVTDSLGGCEFSVESDGAYITYNVGADTVRKKLGSGDVHFFDEIFKDCTIIVSHPSGHAQNPPTITKTSEYWQSYLRWGTTELSVTHATNCINYDEFNSIEIDYVANFNNSSTNTFYCLDSNGSTLKSTSLNSTTRTTVKIDASDLSGVGKFKFRQYVNGAGNEGHYVQITIYGIELKK